MNELFFTAAVLNLNKFLTIDFDKQTLHNISKLYMIARGHLCPVYGLGNECA